MNQNSPQEFVQFRFQNSLRRYQNPPRKRVKRSQDRCSHCQRKYCYLTSKQRMNLYCESRRKYQLFSRQKMSSYSKKFQGRKDLEKRQISDFVDDGNINGFQDMPNFWQNIQIKGKDSEIFTNYQIFRTQISNKLDYQKNNLEGQVKDQMCLKKKKLLFQIDLGIEQVQDLRNQLQKQLQKFQFTELWSQNQGEDPKFLINIQDQKQQFSDYYQQKQNSPAFKLKIGFQQNIQNIDHQNMQIQKNQKQNNQKNSYLEEDIILNGGRLMLEGQKRQSLSTRILKKTIQAYSMSKVRKLYPQLKDNIESISDKFKKNNRAKR